eukprot:1023769-Rhodomonas_salina.1
MHKWLAAIQSAASSFCCRSTSGVFCSSVSLTLLFTVCAKGANRFGQETYYNVLLVVLLPVLGNSARGPLTVPVTDERIGYRDIAN